MALPVWASCADQCKYVEGTYANMSNTVAYQKMDITLTYADLNILRFIKYRTVTVQAVAESWGYSAVIPCHLFAHLIHILNCFG